MFSRRSIYFPLFRFLFIFGGHFSDFSFFLSIYYQLGATPLWPDSVGAFLQQRFEATVCLSRGNAVKVRIALLPLLEEGATGCDSWIETWPTPLCRRFWRYFSLPAFRETFSYTYLSSVRRKG